MKCQNNKAFVLWKLACNYQILLKIPGFSAAAKPCHTEDVLRIYHLTTFWLTIWCFLVTDSNCCCQSYKAPWCKAMQDCKQPKTVCSPDDCVAIQKVLVRLPNGLTESLWNWTKGKVCIKGGLPCTHTGRGPGLQRKRWRSLWTLRCTAHEPEVSLPTKKVIILSVHIKQDADSLKVQSILSNLVFAQKPSSQIPCPWFSFLDLPWFELEQI